jgi:hypothetical protein
MMNVKRLLVSVVACGVVASSTAMVSRQQTNKDLGLEPEKWAYIQQNLGKCLDDSSSFFNKTGEVFNKHAKAIAGTLGISSSVVCLIGWYFVKEFFSGLKLGWLCRKETTLEKWILPVGIGVIAGGVCFGLSKLIGQALERKAVRCNQVLTSFVSQWDKHKQYTPGALRPLFEMLHQDLAQNGGKFSKIDDKKARSIVENILAGSVVASVIK